MYPFTIKAPFYASWWFRLLSAAFIIGIIGFVIYWRNRIKTNRARWEQRLREEEQAIIRQKTAEDFHDEIGNKLTRINLLTTIAEGKLNHADKATQELLQQIKQHATSLYLGSKDIIWSLQPESDYLDEIITRIHTVIEDMLRNTDIKFQHKIINPEQLLLHKKMPVDYSRNLIMIFKELVNNAVKYAHAQHITFEVFVHQVTIDFLFKDDGIGYDSSQEQSGNGLKNIKNRVARIHAQMDTESGIGAGTTTHLIVKY